MNETDLPNDEDKTSDEWKSWPPETYLHNLTHELRTPLLLISGYTDVLSDETIKEMHPQAIKIISKYIGELARVIDSIPEYARELEKRKPNN